MSDSLEKKNHYNSLYPFYKELLTEKQQEVFETYYFDDFSLAEIAESFEVSRNAIWDLLKKVEHNLDEYEAKLRLCEKNIKLEKQLDLLSSYCTEEGIKIINEIKEME